MDDLVLIEKLDSQDFLDERDKLYSLLYKTTYQIKLAKQKEDTAALKKAGQTYNKTLKDITGVYIDNFGPIIGLLYLELFLQQMNYFAIVSRVEINKAVEKIKTQKIATTDI